jgi:2'-5' RNA ligase
VKAHRDHHATIFVPTEVAGPIEAVRRTWDGVYIAVDDLDGGYRALRTDILKPPFAPLDVDVVPHVTLVHPRTSTHGRACWEAARPLRMECEFTVTDVALTAFDGTRWDVLETCPLLGRP